MGAPTKPRNEPLTTGDEESGVRRAERSGDRVERLLVVVSSDAGRAHRVAAHARDRIRVCEVRDLFELLEVAERRSDCRLVILIDGELRGARRGGLAIIARVFPPDTEVVLWGVTPALDVPMKVRLIPRTTAAREAVDVCLEAGAPEAQTPERPVIVLAEDEPTFRRAVRRVLERDGRFDVVTCADGFEALEACIDHSPVLLITDYEMPVLDGAKLAKCVRERFRDEAPKIVILSGSVNVPDRDADVVIAKRGRLSALLNDLLAHLPE